MAKVFGRPLPLKGFPSPRLPEEIEVDVPQLNGGMITLLDKTDVPDNAWTNLKNARVRYDKTSRRVGKSRYANTKPDANRIRRVIGFSQNPNALTVLRITNTTIHRTNGAAWTALTGSLNGGNADLINVAVALGKVIIANGVDRLQLIDFSDDTFADLDDSAPRARYVTTFAERLIAANSGSSAGSLATVYWSGNRKITEFNTVEDISAGNQELISSSPDSVDPISGIIGFTSVMIIPRYRSIWLATRQLGNASNPFHFYPAIPTIGCEVPGSIAPTSDGIMFLSLEHGTVFKFRPGAPLEDIGRPIAQTLLDNIVDPSKVTSSYNKAQREYHILVPSDVLGVPPIEVGPVLFTYNEITKAWSYDLLGYDASSIDIISLLSAYTAFDDLTGTFDALTGTFDDLSDTPTIDVTPIYGTDVGELYKEDTAEDTDKDAETIDLAYTFEARTKEFVIPRNDLIFTYLRYEYEATTSGSIVLEYSKDGGDTWTTARTYTTTTGSPQIIKFKKVIKARRIMWRLTAADGIFDLLSFEARFHASGESSS